AIHRQHMLDLEQRELGGRESPVQRRAHQRRVARRELRGVRGAIQGFELGVAQRHALFVTGSLPSRSLIEPTEAIRLLASYGRNTRSPSFAMFGSVSMYSSAMR